ncbi:hypothetical protein L1D13_19125 [Vibrio tubiashii]|uniref:hypothetical protein n=1 Tax=Vibrio tubiashii TaxID=29498 RepID=UPI001EFC8872|nr:hypothetical protein [Vibrio tubiashii]MCG9582352.1 hypothetical protein [Vibrio tubiashii]MCG9615943.1 hypothetical protein [Vibrio tubiashii]MCG9689022.1 hypothetical protein [Vibrio tubiashii]
MKAKKTLKKLLKKSKKKSTTASLEKLHSLKKEHIPAAKSNNRNDTSLLASELKELAGQVALSAAQELAQPLNPVISWFNDGGGYIDLTTPANESVAPNIQKANIIPTQSQPRSVVSLPLKSPPCKHCPALQNGICKCAAKKFKMSA